MMSGERWLKRDIMTAQVDYVAIGSVIIDDIIDPQGRSSMGTLGGGGSHAVAGMRVWSDNTALVSVIGEQFPAGAWTQLTTLADTRGIVQRPVPQPRFWQLFEADGTRHEVPRTDFQLFQQISIRPEEYPATFSRAKGVFVQTDTADGALAWIARLKSLNPDIVILWEPWEIFYKPDNVAEFCRVAPHVDIISPQTVELSRMIGQTEPHRQASMLFEYGVRCLALRLGAAGSLVGTAAARYHLPAAPARVVDETGAGNAYCGGFVAGYVESGGDPVTAGQYGAVSATFALAQVGIAQLQASTRHLAETRLRELTGQLTQ